MKTIMQTVILMKRLGLRAMAQRANRLLSLSIIICTCVAASLSFFAKSVQTALDNDIATFLGAPLVVHSNWPVLNNMALIKELAINELSSPVYTATFTTGAISEYAYQSVSLKSVSNGYPLQGQLLIRTHDGERSLKGTALKSNQVWIDQRAMAELNVDLGDQVQIGSSSMIIMGEVIFEPDRLTQLQRALPRVFVSQQGLANSGVSNDNERGKFRVLFDGSTAALTVLENQLPRLIKHKFGVLKPGAGQHPFARISLRAERMLNVVLILILLMCGGAAATLADYSVRQYAMPATVLRCMGVNRQVVGLSLCLQLFILALVMSLVGCVFGWLLQYILVDVMQPHMTLEVACVEFLDLFGPIGIGLVTVVTFVMPKLQQLGSMSVSSVLRGHIDRPKRTYVTPLFATVLVVSMLWASSDNAQLTMMLVGAVVFLIILSLGFGWGLTKLSAQAHRFFRGPLKVAVRSIGRSPSRHITPLASISVAMMAVLMTVTMRGSFLDVLYDQRLEADGNYIYSGLPESKKEAFVQVLKQTHADLRSMHPTVSAKLISVNGVSLDKALKKQSDTREETRSNVRLSWASSLPENNTLVQGSWPVLGSNDVSVEDEVMSDLGLELGDRLGFQIGDEVLISTISSRREHRSGGSKMMFWFMFAPDTLAKFEQRLMGGIMLQAKPQIVLGELSQRFPQVRISDLERQISGIRAIMVVITRLMNTTLVLLLGGALMVIVTSSFASTANRQSQFTLMRALGLRRSQCYGMSVIEQLTIGLVACVVGLLGVQLIGAMMFHSLFALVYELDWWRAISLTLLISGTFAILSWVFAYRNLQTPVRLSV